MRFPETNRYLTVFKAVLAGLITAQVIGFVHVYLSNKHLYESLQIVRQTGYLAVPNEHVWGSLQGWGTAFWGGMFFALSIGAGLSVVALLGAWIWDRLFGRWRPPLVTLIFAWIVGIFAVNANGVSLIASAYPAFIIPVVFLFALRRQPAGQGKSDRRHRALFLAAPVLLCIVWLPLARGHVFLDIRDNVLLGNAFGKKINDFYYDNTLYAAQAFKSLQQKTLRTCRLELAGNASHRSVLEDVFLSYDYLVVDGDSPVDLSVKERGDELLFMHGRNKILTTTIRKFAADPQAFLQDFSNRTDRYRPLRFLSFVSLVIGSPVCLYIVLHGLFLLVLAQFTRPRTAGLLAVSLCLVLGIIWSIPLYLSSRNIDLNNYNQALQANRWQERVAALRYMSDNGLSSEQAAKDYQKWLASPHIAERYWYVRSLGVDKDAAAGKGLLAALDDADINVVCMAFYGLGRRGDESVIDEIIERLGISAKWYEQMYGYRALRTLGWHQKQKNN